MNELENKAAEAAETIPEVSVAVEETIENETPQAEAETSSLPDYHTFDKPALVEALLKIVEEKRVCDHKEVALIKQSFYGIRNKELDQELADFIDAGNDVAAFAATPDPEENRFKDALAEFRTLRNAYLEEEEKKRQANLAAKNEILEKIKEVVADIDNVNLRFKEFQQLQADFKAIKDVPPTNENELWKAYQAAEQQFFDHLHMNNELRDLAFKKNLEAKRAIIEEARALVEATDVIESSRKLQDMHVRWKDIGPVAKELRDSIWEEFKAISTTINKRHQDFFTARKEEEAANEAAKNALIAEAEKIDTSALTRYKEWDEATDKVKELQAEWKKLGFASRKVNNQLFATFRGICDRFFEAKAAFYKGIKSDQAENLARKEALVARAEALKENAANLNECIKEVQKLREEWRTIGSVAKKHSDEIWARFNAACDFFFDERRRRNSDQRQEENANLEAKRQVIADLEAIDREQDRQQLLAAVRELQAKWQSIGFVPFKKKDEVNNRYRELCDEIYGLIGSAGKRQRMASFENQMSQMKGDNSKVGQERDKLLRVLDAKRNELKTIQNNLGFFSVKSTGGNSMVKEIERRAERIRQDIEEIEGKIKMLDSAAKE